MGSMFRGVKNPQKALLLLEKLYLYGALAKPDVMSLFAESFSASEKRLHQLLKDFGENHIKTLELNQQAAYYADYDYLKDYYNYLMKIYALKSTTPSRLKAYFLVLSALREKPNLTSFQLLDALSEKGHLFGDYFIRDLLRDMSEHGVIKKMMCGNKNQYCIVEDTLINLNETEILNLRRALIFFSNTLYPFASGDLTLKNTQAYATYHRKITLPSTPWIRVVNRSFHLTLYEEYVWFILKTMESGDLIEVQVDGSDEPIALFKPLSFELPVDDGELYLRGTLENSTEGYIRLCDLLDGVLPKFCVLNKNLTDSANVPLTFQLTLSVSFEKEEYQVHRLISLYPHAEFTITQHSITLDLSAYSEEKQLEITLEQIDRLQTLSCSELQRIHLKEILIQGVQNHDIIQ